MISVRSYRLYWQIKWILKLASKVNIEALGEVHRGETPPLHAVGRTLAAQTNMKQFAEQR